MVHISTKEPLIARDLVARNIMKQAACVNVQEFSNQFFWQVSAGNGMDGITRGIITRGIITRGIITCGIITRDIISSIITGGHNNIYIH